MKDNDLGRRASAEPALVGSLPEPQGVSAHSGDGQAQDDCPGHVASPFDAKVCGLCGIHIRELMPDEGEY